jgi:hypothetical protein
MLNFNFVYMYMLSGDWLLPEWVHLSDASTALMDILYKAGSPGLVGQLRDGIKRLKRLQRLEGIRAAAAVSQFKEDYRFLQVRRMLTCNRVQVFHFPAKHRVTLLHV